MRGSKRCNLCLEKKFSILKKTSKSYPIKIRNSFGLPAQQQISGKQPKQRNLMLFGRPHAYVSSLGIKTRSYMFSKFVYHPEDWPWMKEAAVVSFWGIL